MVQLRTFRATLPAQPGEGVSRTSPVQHSRTIRRDMRRSLTSGFAGKFQPLAMFPLLRHDAMMRTPISVSAEMAETASLLANPVRIRLSAFLVSKLAMGRHKDMGEIERSYAGEPEAGGDVTPWFESVPFAPDPGTIPDFYKALGVHAQTGVGNEVNTDYLRAYNAVWNFIANEMSPSLSPRALTDATIAPAFWSHSQMKHVKPTFDQALMHGEVPLTIIGGRLPVHGIGVQQGTSDVQNDTSNYDQWGNLIPEKGTGYTTGLRGYIENHSNLTEGLARDSIWAEMQNDGVSMSLANIDMARKTQAFARMRRQYQGLKDDTLIDMLMQGFAISDQALKQPILLGQTETIFGMQQRFASDGDNLQMSATNGLTQLALTVGTPEVPPGGVVVVCAECLPEQVYERRYDPYLSATGVEHLPNRQKDELDIEPVRIVTNGQIDVDHDEHDDVFGYAPLNHEWQRDAVTLGGKYYKPDAGSAWTEDRNRIWAVETENPQLGTDFYVATNIHQEVFMDTQAEVFEFTTVANANIQGLTFFGPALREATDDFEKTSEHVKRDLIDLDNPIPGEDPENMPADAGSA